MTQKDTDDLLRMLMGATMTQVALFRFLLEEKIIDRDRLVAFLQKQGEKWGATATVEDLLPLVVIKTALESNEEPAFPKTFH